MGRKPKAPEHVHAFEETHEEGILKCSGKECKAYSWNGVLYPNYTELLKDWLTEKTPIRTKDERDLYRPAWHTKKKAVF